MLLKTKDPPPCAFTKLADAVTVIPLLSQTRVLATACPNSMLPFEFKDIFEARVA
jgi:hypothetical protein